MDNVSAYLEYSLFNSNGMGYQPYSQIESLGMTFEGGVAVNDKGRYLGYLCGDEYLVDAVVNSLSAWGAIEITVEEAKLFIEKITSTNTPVEIEGVVKYLNAPIVDENGRITRYLIDEPTGIPIDFSERRTSSIYLVDDFLTGNSFSGSVGDLGWITQYGINNMIPSPTGHVGMIARSTGYIANTIASMKLLTGLNTTDKFSMMWIVRLSQTNDCIVQIGFNNSDDLNPIDGIYFEKLENWICVTRKDSLETRIDTGIQASDQFIKLYLRRIDANTIGFKIDNNEEIACQDTIPNSTLNPTLIISNTTAENKTIEIDYFDLKIKDLTR